MPYIVTTTSGATLTTIADDTVNTTSTSLSLVGKNYAGYGIFLNENFVNLLENFNNSIAPNAPLTGQLWFDNSADILKFYTGAAWKPISTSAASATAPLDPTVGDLWWNTLTSQLSVRGASDWIIIGPSFTATAGTSGAIVETVTDTALLSHVVVKFYISNTVVAILSKDSNFQPLVPIPGFDETNNYINPGMNLISSAVLPSSQFWGNTTNAGNVGGLGPSSFLRSDAPSSNGNLRLTVGQLQATTHLLVDPSPTDVQIYSNGTDPSAPPNTSKDIGIYVKRGGTPTLTQRSIATTGGTQFYGNLTTTNVNPTSDNVSVIGSGTTRYANVFSVSFTGTNVNATTVNATTVNAPTVNATSFNGTFYGNVVGNITGGASGNTTTTGSITINSLNYPTAIVNGGTSGVGNIGSVSKPFNVIHARATSAQYADVAERFEADNHLLPGTVVEIGGIKEITQAVQELSESVFGVISTLPGFLLNGSAGTDITHPAVAVNGRVPVRTIGTCKKGDRLVSAGNGLARAARRTELTAFNVIGRALQDKTTSGEGLVEAIVKLNS
jgi:trimeric autotransporter adhesin